MASAPRAQTAPASTPPRLGPLRAQYQLGGEETVTGPLAELNAVDLRKLTAIRSFGYHPQQRRNPGLYWSATCRAHLAYESRLEMAHMILADFDAAVSWIVPQPFRLQWRVKRSRQTHVPDLLLLLADGGVRLVDVSRPQAQADPAVAERHRVAAVAARRLVWESAVVGLPDPVLTRNVRLLSGFRRRHWGVEQFGDRIVDAAATPMPIAELEARIGLSALVRPAIFHLLWTHRLRADLSQPLRAGTVIERSAA